MARLEVSNLKVFNLVRMFKSIDYHTHEKKQHTSPNFCSRRYGNNNKIISNISSSAGMVLYVWGS